MKPNKQHIEFFDEDHFKFNYHRKTASNALSQFIDYFWETDFDSIFNQSDDGFSDILFPNLGYTYMINLGTPYVLQLGDKYYPVRNDVFLPRYKEMACHHSPGNKLFGIKFKVSPILYEKKINFSEYKDFVYPLSYLIDKLVLDEFHQLKNFTDRVQYLSNYYTPIIAENKGRIRSIDVVTKIIDEVYTKNEFTTDVSSLAERHNISISTLKRFFEQCTGVSTKPAIQVIRIRKVMEQLVNGREQFNYEDFGYFDYSHFHKYFKMFFSRLPIEKEKMHLLFMEKVNKKDNPHSNNSLM